MARVDNEYILEHFSDAVKNGHIQAFYQPIYRSMTGKILCAETLARWIDPERGMLSPPDFIPVLESRGLIFDLDMEMLRQACAFYRELIEKGTPLHTFSVNLSRYDFKHAELFSRVVQTLEEYDVPREAIKLEITESLMLDDIETFQRVFRQFNDAGFSIWLDDFGSGYSSLNVLQNYSFDVIKFDMLFLQNYSAKGRQVLSSLINMAKTLGIHTLTEGVETDEQRLFLRAAGCEALQGYYYSKPLEKQAIAALIFEQAESREDKAYWNRIGQLNFLSANPLKEYEDAEKTAQPAVENGVSIALLEIEPDKAVYVYASPSYQRRIKELGYPTLKELEGAFNDHRSDSYLMLKKMVADAVRLGTLQMVEYVKDDVYYRITAKFLARKRDRAMIALQLSTFDSEREVKTAKEMLSYGNALFSTYELVVLVYPRSNVATRIYASRSLPVYDREGSVDMSVQKFAEVEVAPVDRERYIRFMDFNSAPDRIDGSSKKFIESFFRMTWGQHEGEWHTARVTRIPSSAEEAYLLTIQKLQGNENEILEIFVREHPEKLD